MTGCDLHRTGSKRRINPLVSDDRHFSVHYRHLRRHADKIFIALIVRIDSDSRITEQRLRTSRRNHDIPYLIHEWIRYIVKLPGLFFVHHLDIGKTCLVFRTKVYYPLTSINKFLIP